MNLRVVGEVKLKRDAMCPYCKQVGKQSGGKVEVVVDMDVQKQFAYFHCNNCKEDVMLAQ